VKPYSKDDRRFFAIIYFFALFFAAYWGMPVHATGSNIYFAQTAAGSDNGTSCANAYAYNDGTNGINKSVNWVPGNTLHICGIISVGANTNIVTPQANGTSGNPITIEMDGTGILNCAAAGTGGNSCINLNGASYITVDGGNTGKATGGLVTTSGTSVTWSSGQNFSQLANGQQIIIEVPGSSGSITTYTISTVNSNTSLTLTASAGTNSTPIPYNYRWTGGIVQNYANGSSGQSNCPGTGNTYTGSCSNQVANSTLIAANSSASYITIENLFCLGAVITAGSFGNGAPGNDCLNFQGSNITFTNNQAWHVGTGVDNTGYHGDANTVISGNDFYDNGWGVGCAGDVATPNNTNYQISGNHMWGWLSGSWAGTGTHLNGIHCYDGSGGGILDLWQFNNVFDTSGSTTTGWTNQGGYLQSDSSDGSWSGSPSISPSITVGRVHSFNNIFIDTVGLGNASLQTGGGNGNSSFNNTYWGCQGCSGSVSLQWGGGAVFVVNNAITQSMQFMQDGSNSGCCGAPTNAVSEMDYNAYGSYNSGNPALQFDHGSGAACNSNTLSAWRTCTGFDAHSVTPNNAFTTALSNITVLGRTSTGYIGLSTGQNLSSTCAGFANSAAALACQAGATFAGWVTPAARPSGTTAWDMGADQSGAASGVTLTPATNNYGPELVGSSTAAQSFTVTNSSSSGMTGVSVANSGGNTGDFVNTGAGSPACTSTLNIGSSCVITVNFTPTATGARSTNLKVTYSGGDGAGSQSAALSGVGVTPASAPVFSPVAGSYGSAQSVTITSSGFTVICYNTTGSPSTNGGTGCGAGSTLYSTAVSVPSTETLYAAAGGTGYSDTTASAAYTINGQAATPTFSPVAGTYTGSQNVVISSTTPGATICFTADGTTPTANGAGTCTHGTTYSSPALVGSSLTLKAIASESGFNDSNVGSAAYTINAASITVAPAPAFGVGP
jgi:hypothetical protein